MLWCYSKEMSMQERVDAWRIHVKELCKGWQAVKNTICCCHVIIKCFPLEVKVCYSKFRGTLCVKGHSCASVCDGQRSCSDVILRRQPSSFSRVGFSLCGSLATRLGWSVSPRNSCLHVPSLRVTSIYNHAMFVSNTSSGEWNSYSHACIVRSLPIKPPLALQRDSYFEKNYEKRKFRKIFMCRFLRMGLRTLVMLNKPTILAVNYINFGSIFYTQKYMKVIWNIKRETTFWKKDRKANNNR